MSPALMSAVISASAALASALNSGSGLSWALILIVSRSLGRIVPLKMERTSSVAVSSLRWTEGQPMSVASAFWIRQSFIASSGDRHHEAADRPHVRAVLDPRDLELLELEPDVVCPPDVAPVERLAGPLHVDHHPVVPVLRGPFSRLRKDGSEEVLDLLLRVFFPRMDRGVVRPDRGELDDLPAPESSLGPFARPMRAQDLEVFVDGFQRLSSLVCHHAYRIGDALVVFQVHGFPREDDAADLLAIHRHHVELGPEEAFVVAHDVVE